MVCGIAALCWPAGALPAHADPRHPASSATHFHYTFERAQDYFEVLVPRDRASRLILGVNGRRIVLSPTFLTDWPRVSAADERAVWELHATLSDPSGFSQALGARLLVEAQALRTAWSVPQKTGKCSNLVAAGKALEMSGAVVGCTYLCIVSGGVGCVLCAAGTLGAISDVIAWEAECGQQPDPPSCDPKTDPNGCQSCSIETCPDGTPPTPECYCPEPCDPDAGPCP